MPRSVCQSSWGCWDREDQGGRSFHHHFLLRGDSLLLLLSVVVFWPTFVTVYCHLVSA